jgi:hypothetical protein
MVGYLGFHDSAISDSQGAWRNEFLRSEPRKRGGFPLLPERAFAAVEAVAAAGEFEKLDGDVVQLHSCNELAAVLGWDGFVVDGVGEEGGRCFGGDLQFVRVEAP